MDWLTWDAVISPPLDEMLLGCPIAFANESRPKERLCLPTQQGRQSLLHQASNLPWMERISIVAMSFLHRLRPQPQRFVLLGSDVLLEEFYGFLGMLMQKHMTAEAASYPTFQIMTGVLISP